MSVWVIFSFLLMLSRVAVENLEGQPLPGLCTEIRFSGLALAKDTKTLFTSSPGHVELVPDDLVGNIGLPKFMYC